MLRGRTVVYKHTMLLPLPFLSLYILNGLLKYISIVCIVYISTILYYVSYAALYLSDG